MHARRTRPSGLHEPGTRKRAAEESSCARSALFFRFLFLWTQSLSEELLLRRRNGPSCLHSLLSPPSLRSLLAQLGGQFPRHRSWLLRSLPRSSQVGTARNVIRILDWAGALPDSLDQSRGRATAVGFWALRENSVFFQRAAFVEQAFELGDAGHSGGE